MTKKVFWDDPYLTRLDTHVTSVSGNDVTVAETIYYAFSGGQESDAGTIGDHAVREARKHGMEIVYTLDDAARLSSGDPVTMTIDWARRYRLMRLHFAAEIILELVYQNAGAVQKIGAHIAQDKARIDFEWDGSIASLFPMLQDKSAALIAADLPITSAYTDEANERRCWEIAGFGRVACGGTHLRRTGEVGALELSRKNIGRGKERIEIYINSAI